MAGLSGPIGYSTDSRRSALRFDFPLIAASVLLLMFGLMSLYSVSQGFQEPWFKKQLIYVAIGLVPFGLFAAVHPMAWKKGANWIYLVDLALLVAVLAMGRHAKGAGRWIPLPGGMEFQPSELVKLMATTTLASFYANRQDAMDKASTFWLGLLHIAVPALLIKMQPHLGAAVALMVMWLAVSLVAGVPLRYLGCFVAGATLLAGVGMRVPAVRAKMLDSYQLGRIHGHSDTKADLLGRNWQTDRAEIAFGEGGVAGEGFGRGEQKAAHFIPEQENDFIVTVIGEEGGLIGCTLLLAAYGFFFYRVFLILLHAREPYYKMIAAGIFAILGFHTFVNMAMVLQIVPVVGLWLPFLSSGGTAMWLCMSCVGLLIGIRRRERRLLF